MAEDSGSLWQRALGIGPIMAMIRDPNFQRSVMAMMHAMSQGAVSAARIEAKLDLLLEEREYDIDTVNRIIGDRIAAAGAAAVVGGTGGGPSLISLADGAAGARPVAAASDASDDGARITPPATRRNARRG